MSNELNNKLLLLTLV